MYLFKKVVTVLVMDVLLNIFKDTHFYLVYLFALETVKIPENLSNFNLTDCESLHSLIVIFVMANLGQLSLQRLGKN